MTRKKYDRSKALKLYQEFGNYNDVAQELGCSDRTARAVVLSAQGFCYYCKEPAIEGHVFCERHLEIQRKQSNKIRQRRIANKICQRCGKPLDRDAAHCSSCAKIITEQVKKRSKEAVAKGICGNCRIRPLASNSTAVCQHCLDRIKQRSKRVRKERKEQGLCIRCGLRPFAENNINYCKECRDRDNQRKRIAGAKTEWANVRRQAFKRDNHCCVICGEPATIGHHLDESGRGDSPNDSLENTTSLCHKHHTQLTFALDLLKVKNIEMVLELLTASPKNRLQDFLHV